MRKNYLLFKIIEHKTENPLVNLSVPVVSRFLDGEKVADPHAIEIMARLLELGIIQKPTRPDKIKLDFVK